MTSKSPPLDLTSIFHSQAHPKHTLCISVGGHCAFLHQLHCCLGWLFDIISREQVTKATSLDPILGALGPQSPANGLGLQLPGCKVGLSVQDWEACCLLETRLHDLHRQSWGVRLSSPSQTPSSGCLTCFDSSLLSRLLLIVILTTFYRV